MIFTDFSRALGQIGDSRFRRVLLLGVGGTILILIGFSALFVWGMRGLAAAAVALPGVGAIGWLGDVLTWGSVLGMIFLSSFLMVPVASAVTSLFLDDVVQAVEDRHYPGLPRPPKTGFGDMIRETLGFLGVLIGANLVALLLYGLLPFLAPFIFYGLNGFLLGREYFQLAAARREGRAGASALQSRHGGTIWFAGILMAIPLSIPIVNLIIPVLGAATFTHLYHRLSGR